MKIGLALSGGGVKGATHIGVLQALEENEVKISTISGTSIGSIVASLYAMGYTTDEMLKLFKYFAKTILKTDPKYLISNIRTKRSILGEGIISGQAIEDAINECAKLKNIKYIKDIAMPIAIPTVDIKTGKEIIFTNANINNEYIPEDEVEGEYLAKPKEDAPEYINDVEIGKAVRASCSYPVVFSPLEYENYKFVDGGVLNNIPANELRKLGAEKVITVKFGITEAPNINGSLDILFRCIDLVFDDRDSRKILKSDYILNVDVSASSVFDIKKIDYCYNRGYLSAMREMYDIKEAVKERRKRM